jgi:hypothetical protein
LPDQAPIEVTVIRTGDAIDHLAGRIERAYRRRNPRWTSLAPTQGVWNLAAMRLLDASMGGPNIPIDPELFVAVLAPGGTSPNPRVELTQRTSRIRYLKAVRLIIGRLRRELRTELRLAERRIASSKGLEETLDDERELISPLTRYILAFRAGRFDLVLKHRESAQAQHRSCPLYRQASSRFLPDHAYPCSVSEADSPIGQEAMQFSLN